MKAVKPPFPLFIEIALKNLPVIVKYNLFQYWISRNCHVFKNDTDLPSVSLKYKLKNIK